MLLIPAIDLKDGHCVRLKQGDMGQATTFSEDPAAMAKSWLAKGARRLHLVDLNGAFAGKPQNYTAIKSILKAVGRDRPVGMVHIDAHCDTAGSYEGSKFHHGGPFREAVLAGVLDPRRCIQIGIRGGSEYLWEFSYDSGMTVIHAGVFANGCGCRGRACA